MGVFYARKWARLARQTAPVNMHKTARGEASPGLVNWRTRWPLLPAELIVVDARRTAPAPDACSLILGPPPTQSASLVASAFGYSVLPSMPAVVSGKALQRTRRRFGSTGQGRKGKVQMLCCRTNA